MGKEYKCSHTHTHTMCQGRLQEYANPIRLTRRARNSEDLCFETFACQRETSSPANRNTLFIKSLHGFYSLAKWRKLSSLTACRLLFCTILPLYDTHCSLIILHSPVERRTHIKWHETNEAIIVNIRIRITNSI